MKVMIKMAMLLLILSFKAYSQDTVKTQIAVLVKSGKNERVAKSNDRILTGDLLKIFIKSPARLYYYVINSNEQSTNLLAKGVLNKDSLIIIPAKETQYLKIDGSNEVENISVITSNKTADQVEQVFNEGIKTKPAVWKAVEEKLLDKYSIIQSDKVTPIYNIGGNVRDLNVLIFRTYIGNGMLVKKYNFDVKK